jgi:hypothetical protein
LIDTLAFLGDRDVIRPNYRIAGQNGAFRSDNATTIAAAAIPDLVLNPTEIE